MPEWESEFPNLGNWQQTSPFDTSYNCAAFAAGDNTRWWDPFPPGVYYWPSGVPRGYEADKFVRLFETLGYEVCQDGSVEESWEKIVIYLNKDGFYEHVARQLPEGRWTSKIGIAEDIVHETPESLSGGYGQPLRFMRRHLKSSKDSS